MVSEGSDAWRVTSVHVARGGILFVIVYSHENFPYGLRRSHGQPSTTDATLTYRHRVSRPAVSSYIRQQAR